MPDLWFLRVGMPIGMLVSGIVAWRMARGSRGDEARPAWRDDSLDEWRRQRAAEHESQRTDPAGRHDEAGESTAAERPEVEQGRQSRIGG